MKHYWNIYETFNPVPELSGTKQKQNYENRNEQNRNEQNRNEQKRGEHRNPKTLRIEHGTGNPRQHRKWRQQNDSLPGDDWSGSDRDKWRPVLGFGGWIPSGSRPNHGCGMNPAAQALGSYGKPAVKSQPASLRNTQRCCRSLTSKGAPMALKIGAGKWLDLAVLFLAAGRGADRDLLLVLFMSSQTNKIPSSWPQGRWWGRSVDACKKHLPTGRDGFQADTVSSFGKICAGLNFISFKFAFHKPIPNRTSCGMRYRH